MKNGGNYVPDEPSISHMMAMIPEPKKDRTKFGGKVKFYGERLRQYYGWSQPFIIIWLAFIKDGTISLWWLLVFVPLSAAILFVDRRFILPGELHEGLEMNPKFKKMAEQIEELHKRLNP